MAAYPGLSPSETAALAQEADAAYSRCKAVLPPGWQAALRSDKGSYKTMEAVVRAHLVRSPDSWQPGIHVELQQQALAGMARHRTRREARPTCDACLQEATSLRRCAGCKVKQYVSGGGRRHGMPMLRYAMLLTCLCSALPCGCTGCRGRGAPPSDQLATCPPPSPQCSRACQVKDWKEGGHKAQCAALAAQRAASK